MLTLRHDFLNVVIESGPSKSSEYQKSLEEIVPQAVDRKSDPQLDVPITTESVAQEVGGDHGNQYTGGKVALVEIVPQPADRKRANKKSRDKAAEAYGISPRAVGLAKTVKKRGSEKLIDSVDIAQLLTHNKYPKSVKTLQRCKRLYAIAATLNG